MEQDRKMKLWGLFLDLGQTVVIFFALYVIIHFFLFRPFQVSGASMYPYLHDREYLITNIIGLKLNNPKLGDIVVFKSPSEPTRDFIKRVIGVPGDEIRITNGKLYINNSYVPEPYLSAEYTSNVIPNRYWIVDEHHYFVMGDNRDASNDSRAWGLVPEKYIYGKAIFRYWPLDSIGSIGD